MIDRDPVPDLELPDFSWPPAADDNDLVWLHPTDSAQAKTVIEGAFSPASGPLPELVTVPVSALSAPAAAALSLSQIFSGQIPYTWQDAVAVVVQLADQV